MEYKPLSLFDEEPQLGIETRPGIGTVISSRIIALELNKRHFDVMESVRGIRNDSHTPFGYIFADEYENEQNGQTYQEYLLTKDGFILYVFNIVGHNEFKVKYIKKFNEMEKALSPKNILPNFNNPVEAARAWADTEEKRQKLEKENKLLLPKAELADAALRDKEEHYSITEAGKHLGLRQSEIFEILRDNKLLTLNNLPSQKSIDYKVLFLRTNAKEGQRNHPQAVMNMENMDNFRKRYIK